MADYPAPASFVIVTPVDSEYAALVGHAVYAFGYLEWQVVSLAEKLDPGFVQTTGRMTARNIAAAFKDKVTNANVDARLQSELAAVATQFEDLVDSRNRLVHAAPSDDRR